MHRRGYAKLTYPQKFITQEEKQTNLFVAVRLLANLALSWTMLAKTAQKAVNARRCTTHKHGLFY